MRALEAGKHVLVEKPLTADVAQAAALIDEADGADRVLMVDHTFVYTGAVRKIRELVDGGRAGRHLLLRLGARQPRACSSPTSTCSGISPSTTCRSWTTCSADRPTAVSADRVSHVARPAREHRVLHLVFAEQPARPRPRQLARAGEDAPHAHRRRPQDDRLRRPRAEREGQGLRRGITLGEPRPTAPTSCSSVPHRRHVGAEGDGPRRCW